MIVFKGICDYLRYELDRFICSPAFGICSHVLYNEYNVQNAKISFPKLQFDKKEALLLTEVKLGLPWSVPQDFI